MNFMNLLHHNMEIIMSLILCHNKFNINSHHNMNNGRMSSLCRHRNNNQLCHININNNNKFHSIIKRLIHIIHPEFTMHHHHRRHLHTNIYPTEVNPRHAPTRDVSA